MSDGVKTLDRGMTDPLDPVTLSVLWSAFVATAREMGGALRHTAVSTPVREGDDFSTGLFDADGRMVAQGDFSPGHLGSMPFAVLNALEYYPREALRPGDGIVMNDPYMGAGHLPDAFLISPIFSTGGDLVAFSVTVTHLIDIGGVTPGGMGTEGITELYAEGLRLLPVKLFKEGVLDEEIARILCANVRIPDAVIGDLKAQRNANRIGASRVQELIDRYGQSTVAEAMAAAISGAEERVREEIRRLPDGKYSAEDYMDDTGRGTPPVKIAVTVTIDGDELTFDFTGTDPQTPSGMNSTFNYTRAYVLWAMKCVVAPDVPQNHGGVAPVRVVAPEGSYVNPRHPAACGGRALNNHRLTEVIFAALAQAAPERVVAASSHISHPVLAGVDPRTGKQFVSYDLIIGGWGARATRDGCEALTMPSNARNIPIEILEAEYPVAFEAYELIPDTGGPGRHRGGCGVRRDIRVLCDGVSLGNMTDRQRFPPGGLFGGDAGAKGQTLVNPGTPHESPLGAKELRTLSCGDVVSSRLAGGGGYGPAVERDPERVRRDVAEGYVSVTAAADRYGVVLNPATGAVDQPATRELRARLDGHDDD